MPSILLQHQSLDHRIRNVRETVSVACGAAVRAKRRDIFNRLSSVLVDVDCELAGRTDTIPAGGTVE